MRSIPGSEDREFDALFTATSRSFSRSTAIRGSSIGSRTAGRTIANLHVRGYKERGTTTTPFDMVVLNDLDRFHLVGGVIDRTPGLREKTSQLRQRVRDKLIEHREYITRYGEDLPEIRNWSWQGRFSSSPHARNCARARAHRSRGRPAAEHDDLERPEDCVRGGVAGRTEHDAQRDESESACRHERRDSPATPPLPRTPQGRDDAAHAERKHGG